MEKAIITETGDKIIEEVLKIVSKEDFENAVTNIAEYFNGIINPVTQPELITIKWDDEIYAYNEAGNKACASYVFPYELVVYARVFLTTTFDSVDDIVGQDEIVKIRVLQGLIYIIIHELSHANQRVDYIRMCYDLCRGKTDYVKYIEKTNIFNSHKFIEENIDEISEEFGFTLQYNLDLDEPEAKYEPITLIMYYREIIELLLARGFGTEEAYNEFMEYFEIIIVILNDNQTDVKIIINDEPLVLKQINRDTGHILFTRPDEVNPFIHENFSQYIPRFVKTDVSFEEEEEHEILVITINSKNRKE